MNYELIKTNEIIDSIDRKLNEDHLTVISSHRVPEVQQYPFSNILLIPEYLEERFCRFLDSFNEAGLSIKKSQILEMIETI